MNVDYQRANVGEHIIRQRGVAWGYKAYYLVQQNASSALGAIIARHNCAITVQCSVGV